MEVGEEGQILEPEPFRVKLNPSIPNWQDYLEEKKTELWDKFLLVNFRLPQGTHALVKRRAMKVMGDSFRRWRNYLNRKYIQRGLTPYHEFGHITPTWWALLMAEKTSPEALARSAKNNLQAKKNVHHPRLGPRWLRWQGRAV
jgi:hypothetical protein